MTRRMWLVIIAYVVIGVIVATSHHDFPHLDGLKQPTSALFAVLPVALGPHRGQPPYQVTLGSLAPHGPGRGVGRGLPGEAGFPESGADPRSRQTGLLRVVVLYVPTWVFVYGQAPRKGTSSDNLPGQ